MATVTTPQPHQVAHRMGLHHYADLEAQLDIGFRECIEEAEAETALSVTEAVYSSATLTTFQARLLNGAVICRAAYIAWGFLLGEKGSGTHQPVLMEDVDAIIALRESLLEDAQRKEELATEGSESSAEEGSAAVRRPSFSASTFVVSDSDRTPLERLELLDETDELSSNDLD